VSRAGALSGQPAGVPAVLAVEQVKVVLCKLVPRLVPLRKDAACSRSRPTGRQYLLRQFGVQERELSPLMDQLRLSAEDRFRRIRTEPAESVGEVAVSLRDSIEIPGVGHHPLGVSDASELRAKREHLGTTH